MVKLTSNNIRFTVALVALFLSTFAGIAQKQDTTFQSAYYVSDDATIHINISHADLMINPSMDDSIRIHSNTSLIPNNIQAPFNGITTFANQKDSKNIEFELLISSEIQPHNQLEAFCQISLPENTNIKINGRYTQIDLSNPFGKLDFDIEYCTLRAVAINPNNEHYIIASYSDLFIEYIKNKLNIEGLNVKLESSEIHHLKSDLKFSTVKSNKLDHLEAISYSDKYLINEADSIAIKGEYSSLLIDELQSFFQSDLSYGALIIKALNPSFSEINIAHKYVSSKITYAPSASFSINADMRYCELISPNIKYKTIVSPSSTLYQGAYGKTSTQSPSLSIISSFGDITLESQ